MTLDSFSILSVDVGLKEHTFFNHEFSHKDGFYFSVLSRDVSLLRSIYVDDGSFFTINISF